MAGETIVRVHTHTHEVSVEVGERSGEHAENPHFPSSVRRSCGGDANSGRG